MCIISSNWTFFCRFFLRKAVSRSFRTFLCILHHCEIYKDLCIKIPTNLDVSFQEMHLREEGRYSSYFLYNEIFVEESCFVMTFFHEKKTTIKLFESKSLFSNEMKKKYSTIPTNYNTSVDSKTLQLLSSCNLKNIEKTSKCTWFSNSHPNF